MPPRSVILVTAHADTAELYRMALEAAGFDVQCLPEPEDAISACRTGVPLSVIVHVRPCDDPVAIGTQLRLAAPGTTLIGLCAMNLPPARLKPVLESFDDMLGVPCVPQTLLARLLSLLRRRARSQSA